MPLQHSTGFSALDEAGKLCAGWGAYALWLLIAPSRFGERKLSVTEMLEKHEYVQKELRMMFPAKPTIASGSLNTDNRRNVNTDIYCRAFKTLQSVREFRPDYEQVKGLL